MPGTAPAEPARSKGADPHGGTPASARGLLTHQHLDIRHENEKVGV